jgi:thiol-disulfide isomerase/thioredoxin
VNLRRAFAVLLLAVAGSAMAQQVGDRVELPGVALEGKNSLSAAALRGKPVLVVFWASWCPYCANHLPHVQKLYEKTRGTDLQIIAVSVDKDAGKAREYMDRKRYGFALTMDHAAFEKALTRQRKLPYTIMIGRDGRVAFAAPGEMLEDDVLELARFAGAGASPTYSR